MLKIRLQPTGKKKQRMFRIVVQDSKVSRDSAVLDTLGNYNPHKKPLEIEVDFDKVDKWMGKGAQISDTARTLINRARGKRFADLEKRKKVSKHKKKAEKDEKDKKDTKEKKPAEKKKE